VFKFDHCSNSKLVKPQTGQIWPLVKLPSGQIRSVPGLGDFHQVVKFRTGQTWPVVKFDHWSNSKLVKFDYGQIQTLVKLLTGQIRSVPGHRVFEQTGQIRDFSNLTSGQNWPLLKFQTGQILDWSTLTTGQAPNWSTPLSPGLWPVWPLFD